MHIDVRGSFLKVLLRAQAMWLAALLGIVAPQAHAQWLDDFDRPAGDEIGNGWIEKTPGAFSLADGAARKNAYWSDYINNIVYRPSTENLLDVEVAVEIEFDVVDGAYAQIMTRVQSETVAFDYWLDGYMLYIDGGSRAILGRQTGWEFVSTLATIDFSSPLNTSDRYRLRLRSVGTSPVQLDAFVERQIPTGWEIIGSASYADQAANRITTPGSVGFGGYVEDGYRYDNFTRTDLGGTANPVPVLSSVSPTNAAEGGSAFVLTVTGSGFIPESTVRWNGDDRATVFVSSAELLASITADDIAEAGAATVTVFTPGPGGGLSGSAVFTIGSGGGANPEPQLTAVTPSAVTEGSGPLVVTAQGANFVPGSVVRFNGSDRATTFVSASELTATITAADVAAAGTATITVFTPAPGGGVSAGQSFTIEPSNPSNPVPSLTGVLPESVVAGSGGLTLTVQGENFIPGGSLVRINGMTRPTTYVSPTVVEAQVQASDVSIPGNLVVDVLNLEPGGGVSNGGTLTVTPIGGGVPVPAIAGLDVDYAVAGSGETTFSLFGTNFSPGTTVRFNGTDRPTTYISDEIVEFTLTAADLAVPGVGTITVSTPTGGTSAPQPFFVLGPGQSYFFDNFNAPDSETIGNDWTEKYPDAFSLVDNQLEGVITWSNIVYRDSIVYRPEDEDRRDVEVAMEFVRRPGSEYAQVHARVQRDIVERPNFLESYILYIEDGFPWPGGFSIAVQPGIDSSGECLMTFTEFPQPLEIGGRYRLRFRVTGEYPVQLYGAVDMFDGETWQELASETIIHDNSTQRDPDLYCAPGYMPPPIRNGGATGFSKWYTLSDYYDNFYWIDLGTDDEQIPEIGGFSPEFIEAGAPAFNLLVTGQNFTADSVVQWNGSDRPTVFVSSGMLRAEISAADIAAPGSASITVVGAGTVSAPIGFDIVPPGTGLNPEPAIASVEPQAFTAGAGNSLLTVDGVGFVSGTVLRWNGTDLSTTYVSPTRVVAQVPAELIASVGGAAVTAFNPAPAGGQSAVVSVPIVPSGGFIDAFDRPDALDIGNGWIEKDGAAFSLSNGRAVKSYSYSSYTDNVVYRPSAEAVLDSEVSAEFRLLNAQAPGYAQIFARLQPSTVQIGGWLDGYMLYIDDSPTRVILGRQTGAEFVSTLAVLNLAEPMNAQSTYRLRLSVSGTGSVEVSGYVDRLDASGWITIGSATVNDTSAQRIETPGVAAFSGYVEANYSFDNFIWTAN